MNQLQSLAISLSLHTCCRMNPTQKTTQSEYAVIFVGSSAALIILGLIGFAVRIFAAPQKAEVASELTNLSAGSVGFGAFIGFIYWLIRRITG
jgi:preprotein translocase subunit Sss1